MEYESGATFPFEYDEYDPSLEGISGFATTSLDAVVLPFNSVDIPVTNTAWKAY